MADIPTISITREETIDDDENDEDDGCDISQAYTDIEDLESDDDNQYRFKCPIRQLKLKRKNCKRIANDATDIEDYNASDSDVVKKLADYEPVISLNEFLDQGYVNEANSISKTDRRSQSVEYKMQNLGLKEGDTGVITDCENIETSGDEGITIVMTPANYDNFLIDNEDGKSICIQNSLSKSEESAKVNDVIVTSDSDFEQLCERKTRRKKNIKSRNTFQYNFSDVENIMFTDDEDACSGVAKQCQSEFEEEEIVFESSDTENSISDGHLPQFDITFAEGHLSTDLRGRKLKSSQSKASGSNCGLIFYANDDGCTDIENLNSSDEDDNDDHSKSHLFIPTAFVKSDLAPVTDVEDFGSEDDVSLQENVSRYEMKMPSPVREITWTKENATGTRMSKVMPMNGNLFLGIDESYIDKGMTDTEEMSGKEEDYCDANKYVIEQLPAIDGGITKNSEYYLPLQYKKLENELESITDTEDINISRIGVRRRKPKSKTTSKKSRNFLEPKDVTNVPITDTEDLYMDDDQHEKKPVPRKHVHAPLMVPSNDDGITDVESLSGDEEEIELKTNDSDAAAVLAQESFFSTVTSRDISNSGNMKFQTVEIPIVRKLTTVFPEKSYLTCTDTEEMQMVSDSDDLYLDIPSRTESVTPELHTIFSESEKSTIHHTNINRFDVSNESRHIKGHKEYQDAVTDVEYLDDDGIAQNDACHENEEAIQNTDGGGIEEGSQQDSDSTKGEEKM